MVEIRIGESAGEGEYLLDVGLVVQMRGTQLEDGEVHRELVPQNSFRIRNSLRMHGFSLRVLHKNTHEYESNS